MIPLFLLLAAHISSSFGVTIATSVGEITLARTNPKLLHGMFIVQLLLGVILSYIVGKKWRKLVKFLPVTVLMEGVILLILLPHQIMIAHIMITMVSSLRLAVLFPGIRVSAKQLFAQQRFLNEEVVVAASILILSIAASWGSIYFPKMALTTAALIGGSLLLLAAAALTILAVFYNLPEVDDTRDYSYSKVSLLAPKNVEEVIHTTSNRVIALIWGSFGLMFASQAILSVRPLAPETGYTTLYMAFSISQFLAIFTALFYTRKGIRIAFFVGATRAVAPLLLLLIGIAMISQKSWLWALILPLLIVFYLGSQPFSHLIHELAPNKVKANTTHRIAFLSAGLIVDSLFLIFYAVGISPHLLLWGLIIPSVSSLLYFLYRIKWHLLHI